MKRFLCLIAVLVALTGCAKTVDRTDFPLQIEGLNLKYPPSKVVTMAPATTQLLYTLGYGGRIVGTVEESVIPSAAVAKATCGTQLFPDLDVILSLKPDLVISQGTMPQYVLDGLATAKVPVLTIGAAVNIEELYKTYGTICQVFEGTAKGSFKEQQIRFMGGQLLGSAGAAAQGNSFLMMGDDNLFATEDSLVGNVLSTTGAKNAAAGEKWHLSDSKEINPDVIFYNGELDVQEIMKNSVVKESSAVKNEKLSPFKLKTIEAQTPEMFLEIFNMFRIAYPDEIVDMPNIVMEMPEPVVVEKSFFDKLLSK